MNHDYHDKKSDKNLSVDPALGQQHSHAPVGLVRLRGGTIVSIFLSWSSYRIKQGGVKTRIIRASKMPIDGQLHRHKSVLKVFFISGLTFTLALYISYRLLLLEIM